MRVEKTMKKFTGKTWKQKYATWQNSNFGLHKTWDISCLSERLLASRYSPNLTFTWLCI